MKCYSFYLTIFVVCCSFCLDFVKPQVQLSNRGRIKFGQLLTKNNGESYEVGNSTYHQRDFRKMAVKTMSTSAVLKAPRPTSRYKIQTEELSAMGQKRARGSKNRSTGAIAYPSTDEPVKSQLPARSAHLNFTKDQSRTRSSSLTIEQNVLRVRKKGSTTSSTTAASQQRARKINTRSSALKGSTKKNEAISFESLNTATTPTNSFKKSNQQRTASKIGNDRGTTFTPRLDEIEDENYPEHFKLLLKNKPDHLTKANKAHSSKSNIRRNDKSVENSDEILQLSRAVSEVRRVKIRKEDARKDEPTPQRIERSNRLTAERNEIMQSTKPESKNLFKPRRAEPYRPKPTRTSVISTTEVKENVERSTKYKPRVNPRPQFASLQGKPVALPPSEHSKNRSSQNNSTDKPKSFRALPLSYDKSPSLDNQTNKKKIPQSSMKYSSRYRGDPFSRYQLKSETTKSIYVPTVPTIATTETVVALQGEESILYNSKSALMNNKQNFQNTFGNGDTAYWNIIEPIPDGLTRSDIVVDVPEQSLQQTAVTISIFGALADILSKNAPTTTPSTTSATTTTTTTTTTTELPQAIQVLGQKTSNYFTVNKHIITAMDDIKITNDRHKNFSKTIDILKQEISSVDPVYTNFPISRVPSHIFTQLNTNNKVTITNSLMTHSKTNYTSHAFTNQNLTTSLKAKTKETTYSDVTTPSSFVISQPVTVPNSLPTNLPMPDLAEALTTPGSTLLTQPHLITAISNILDTSAPKENFSDSKMKPSNTTVQLQPVTISFLDLFTIKPVKIAQQTEDLIDIHPVYGLLRDFGLNSSSNENLIFLKNSSEFDKNDSKLNLRNESGRNVVTRDEVFPKPSSFFTSGSKKNNSKVSVMRSPNTLRNINTEYDTINHTTINPRIIDSTITSKTIKNTKPLLQIQSRNLCFTAAKNCEATPNPNNFLHSTSTLLASTYRSRFGKNRIPILSRGFHSKNLPNNENQLENIRTSTKDFNRDTNKKQISSRPAHTLPSHSINQLSPIEGTNDFSVYGILPNKTVIRKRPTQNQQILEPSLIVYGILPNKTLVRKYPNGTIAAVGSAMDFEIINIDPKMLYNPLSELYQTSQSSLLKTTSTQFYIEKNDIARDEAIKSVVASNSHRKGERTIRLNALIQGSNESSGIEDHQKRDNLKDSLLSSTASVIVDSNTENTILLDILKRKYLSLENPLKSSNVISLTTARNLIDDEKIEETEQFDIKNSVEDSNHDLSNNQKNISNENSVSQKIHENTEDVISKNSPSIVHSGIDSANNSTDFNTNKDENDQNKYKTKEDSEVNVSQVLNIEKSLGVDCLEIFSNDSTSLGNSINTSCVSRDHTKVHINPEIIPTHPNVRKVMNSYSEMSSSKFKSEYDPFNQQNTIKFDSLLNENRSRVIGEENLNVNSILKNHDELLSMTATKSPNKNPYRGQEQLAENWSLNSTKISIEKLTGLKDNKIIKKEQPTYNNSMAVIEQNTPSRVQNKNYTLTMNTAENSAGKSDLHSFNEFNFLNPIISEAKTNQTNIQLSYPPPAEKSSFKNSDILNRKIKDETLNFTNFLINNKFKKSDLESRTNSQNSTEIDDEKIYKPAAKNEVVFTINQKQNQIINAQNVSSSHPVIENNISSGYSNVHVTKSKHYSEGNLNEHRMAVASPTPVHSVPNNYNISSKKPLRMMGEDLFVLKNRKSSLHSEKSEYNKDFESQNNVSAISPDNLLNLKTSTNVKINDESGKPNTELPQPTKHIPNENVESDSTPNSRNLENKHMTRTPHSLHNIQSRISQKTNYVNNLNFSQMPFQGNHVSESSTTKNVFVVMAQPVTTESPTITTTFTHLQTTTTKGTTAATSTTSPTTSRTTLPSTTTETKATTTAATTTASTVTTITATAATKATKAFTLSTNPTSIDNSRLLGATATTALFPTKMSKHTKALVSTTPNPNPYAFNITTLANTNKELERNVRLLQQLLELQNSLRKNSLKEFSIPRITVPSTATTMTATPAVITYPTRSLVEINRTTKPADKEDIQVLNTLRQYLANQQHKPSPEGTSTSALLTTTSQPNIKDVLKNLNSPKFVTEKTELSGVEDMALLNSVREFGKLAKFTTTKPPTFANRVIELALQNRQISSTTPVTTSNTIKQANTSPPGPTTTTVKVQTRDPNSGLLSSTDLEKHRQDQSQLSADLSLLSRLLGRPVSLFDLPQLAQQLGNTRSQHIRPTAATKATTKFIAPTTTKRTTQKLSTPKLSLQHAMTNDELAEINNNLKLLSKLLGRPVQLTELPTIMQDLRLRRNLKASTSLTSSSSSTTTKATTTIPIAIVDHTNLLPADEQSISHENFIELLKDSGIETNENIESYGKTNDAVLAAILKQQGIGPTSNNFPINDLFNQRTASTQTRPSRPRPTQPQRQSRPILDGLSWLWRTWQQTAPGPRSTRNNRPAATTPLESPLALNSQEDTLKPEGGDYADLSYPTNQGAPGGNGLLGVAFGVTRAVAQFLGAAFQGARRTVQEAIITPVTSQNDAITFAG